MCWAIDLAEACEDVEIDQLSRLDAVSCIVDGIGWRVGAKMIMMLNILV
jgi:hypothetical protein